MPTYQRAAYTISTDPAQLDLDVIAAALGGSYWAATRPRDVIERSLHNSLCFGVYLGQAQVGLARVVTDYATHAWLCDVFVLEQHRGHGLGKWLIETVVEFPELQGIRRILLATRDAHGLYAQYGFKPLAGPQAWMELRRL